MYEIESNHGFKEFLNLNGFVFDLFQQHIDRKRTSFDGNKHHSLNWVNRMVPFLDDAELKDSTPFIQVDLIPLRELPPKSPVPDSLKDTDTIRINLSDLTTDIETNGIDEDQLFSFFSNFNASYWSAITLLLIKDTDVLLTNAASIELEDSSDNG